MARRGCKQIEGNTQPAGEERPQSCFVDEAEKLFQTMENGGDSSSAVDATEGACFFNSSKTTENRCFSSSPATTYRKCLPPSSTALTDASSSICLTKLRGRKSLNSSSSCLRKESWTLTLFHLPKCCEGFTGRDIRGAIEEAMMVAFTDEQRELCQDDLKKSFAGTKSQLPSFIKKASEPCVNWFLRVRYAPQTAFDRL